VVRSDKLDQGLSVGPVSWANGLNPSANEGVRVGGAIAAPIMRTKRDYSLPFILKQPSREKSERTPPRIAGLCRRTEKNPRPTVIRGCGRPFTLETNHVYYLGGCAVAGAAARIVFSPLPSPCSPKGQESQGQRQHKAGAKNASHPALGNRDWQQAAHFRMAAAG